MPDKNPVPTADPLAALRQAAATADPLQHAETPEAKLPAAPSVAQRKAAAKQKAARITASPLIALGVWMGAMLACAGGLFLVREAVLHSSSNAAEPVAEADYKTLYQQEKDLREQAEKQKEDMLRSQLGADLDLKTVPVQPKALPPSPLPLPRPAPAPPALQPVRPAPAPAPAAQPARRLSAQLVRDPKEVLSGTVVNEGLRPNRPDENQNVPSFRASLAANRVMATRLIAVRLTSRVQYVGSGSSELPVLAEVTEDVKVNGRVALPIGSTLIGRITRSDQFGFVEVAFERGRLPGDDGQSFALQGIGVDQDGGVLVATAPRRPDPGGADMLSIATSFLGGLASAGLTQVQQTGSNYYTGGSGSTVISSTAASPMTEAMRQASSQATSILGRSAQEARQVARSGQLDFLMSPGKPFKVLLLSDLVVPTAEEEP